jgi:hypothetical protein
MTWLEIIDTAIKIGLGALIGGLFAYLMNRQTHMYAIDQEAISDQRQTLKDVGIRFEKIHANILPLSLEMLREYELYSHNLLKYLAQIKSPDSFDNMTIPKKPDFDEKRFALVEKLVLELYSLQGVLLLYGYEKMSSIISEYTLNVEKLNPKIGEEKSFEELLSEIGESRDLNDIHTFYVLRTSFYEAANYYLNKLTK